MKPGAFCGGGSINVRNFCCPGGTADNYKDKAYYKAQNKIHCRAGDNGNHTHPDSFVAEMVAVGFRFLRPILGHIAKTADRKCSDGEKGMLPLLFINSRTHPDSKFPDGYAAKARRNKMTELMDCDNKAKNNYRYND
jgi:hypothetical protein